MYAFGSGVLIGTRNDIANPTPINFGLVQNVTIDDKATTKELYGQGQFPIAIGRGTRKLTCKAEVARISGLAMANLFYGITPTAGQLATQYAEAAAVPAATPYTQTAAQGVQLQDDLGVVYAATGLPLTRVAATPAVGQYALNTNTGVYTFAAADTGKAVLLTYTYAIATGGQKFTVTNQLLGTTPTFSAQFYTTFQGQATSLKLFQCTSTDLTFDPKLEEFTTPNFGFSAFADPAGNVMTWSFAEVS